MKTEDRIKLALEQLYSYVDDFDSDCDHRVVMAIKILENNLNAIAAAERHG